jgi:DNA polymerase-3 subunit delta'
VADLFADLIGQPVAAALLQAALSRGHLAPAYLFTGPEGVGRRLGALRFLEGVIGSGQPSPGVRRRLIEGNHPDVLWVEPTYQHQGELIPASRAAEQGVAKRALPQLRLEQVRAVSRFVAGRPLEADRCLVVIEAAELMAEAAANALLKTLEEPGEGLLVLLTSAPERLLSTIRSRCQQIPFHRLDPAAMGQVLGKLEPGSGEPDPPILLALAAGSPGALLSHRRQWQTLPAGLAERLLELRPDPLECLALARDLSEALDLEQQLWLLDWWQLQLWRRTQLAPVQQRIERLRGHLRGFVQPRLAWEVALLDLGGLRAEAAPGR